MDPRPGTRVTDKVTLVEPLGEGAMGSVWLAEHNTLETRVAVKFIATELMGKRLDAAQRFSREATAAAQIRSPHVVQMIDHGLTSDGTPYLVMELLEGESLEERLERAGPLDLEGTAAVISQVAKALTAAHELGVVHRDIKPHNIFLMNAAGETFVKVLDFGIAKRTRVASGQEITEPGMIVGTPQYVSRDLIMGGGQAPIDARVDLWSLAVVAYKCLTFSLPFDGDSLGAICTALAAGRFDPPSARRPELPARVDQWFNRAFAEEPVERFADARELGASFRSLLGRPTTPARPPTMASSRPPAPAPWWMRVGRRRAIALVALGGLLVGAGLALGLGGLSRGPGPAAMAPASSGSSAAGGVARRIDSVSSSTRAGASAPAPRPSASAISGLSASGSTTGSAAPPPPRSGEIFIPAGSVWRGCDEPRDRACKDDEKPGRQVKLSAFYIERTEVPVSAFGHCVLAGQCSDWRVKGYTDRHGAFMPSTRCNWEHPGHARHPMNCVSQLQAAGYCTWIGGRLPTEAQWERAARGDGRRIHPWGEGAPSCALLVMADQGDKGCGHGGTWAAGAKRTDRSAFGVMDMGGNVREWVADWYAADYYDEAASADPLGPERGRWRVTRGGSWGSSLPHTLRTSARFPAPAAARSIYVGFRCARPAS